MEGWRQRRKSSNEDHSTVKGNGLTLTGLLMGVEFRIVNDSVDSILQRFRAAATTFIEAVDSPSNLERSLFLADIGRCLAELYASALYLPSVSPDTLEIEETPFPREELSKLFQSLKGKIGPLDSYWAIFDSTEKGEPVQGSLAGDISEVYYDLKNERP